MVLDGDLVCFDLFNDGLTGKSVEGNARLLGWTDDASLSFLRLPSNGEYKRVLDPVGAKRSDDSEWAATVS